MKNSFKKVLLFIAISMTSAQSFGQQQPLVVHNSNATMGIYFGVFAIADCSSAAPPTALTTYYIPPSTQNMVIPPVYNSSAFPNAEWLGIGYTEYNPDTGVSFIGGTANVIFNQYGCTWSTNSNTSSKIIANQSTNLLNPLLNTPNWFSSFLIQF